MCVCAVKGVVYGLRTEGFGACLLSPKKVNADVLGDAVKPGVEGASPLKSLMAVYALTKVSCVMAFMTTTCTLFIVTLAESKAETLLK